MSTYPITFEADYVESRSRLTTFFRLLLVIPHLIVVSLWGIAAFVVVVVAWFALLFTGRWPAGMYDFIASFMRYSTRVNGYLYLLVDPYPPFSGGDEPGYPVRLHIAPPLPEYNRLKVLLRIFYVIPVAVLVYLLSLVLRVIGFVAWLVIVVIARQPKGIHDVIEFCTSYTARAGGLFLLVTETYPPFTDDHPRQLGEPAPAAAAAPPPAAPEAVFEPPATPTPPEAPAAGDESPPGPSGPSSEA